MYGWCVKPLCREVMPGNYYIDSPRDGSEPQLSALCFTDHAPVYNFNLIKGTVCYTVWLMHHAILQRGRVLKVSPSPIQGHGSIPDSDSIKSGTRLLLTGTNICHNIVWPIRFLQACRKCTWKPYVLSCLSMCAPMLGNYTATGAKIDTARHVWNGRGNSALNTPNLLFNTST